MPPPVEPGGAPALITGAEDLARLVDRLAGERRIAFDTEAASFHRYVDRIYLIQVSSDTETALVDPLALPDLSPLGRLLAREDLEVVFHDADYDLRALDRDYGVRARRVFDTRIAAQLLGEPAVGLAALLLQYFGVQMDKKLQRADWSIRPLTPPMISYAAEDTRYLTRLRAVIAERALMAGQPAAGQVAWVLLASAAQKPGARARAALGLPADFKTMRQAVATLHGVARQWLETTP